MHSKYLSILVLMLGSVMGLQAYDRVPMANFGAGNYPCNTKMPWVDSSFTGLSASVIDPAANGLACVGSNTGLANLLDNNLSNFASINFTVGLGGCNSTLSVVDNDAGDTYAAGTFAGFRIGTAGLLGVSIGSSVTIATYNNGSPVESQVVVNSGLGLNSSLLNGDGTATVGFITTAAFDEIRITYQSLISALFTGTVYHAVVQRYCAGPSLACNVQTRMNNPTFPTIIDGANTGLSGGVCVGCSVNDAENAISNSSSDFATIVLTAALGTTGSIAVKDQITDYAVGTFAGFDISNPNLINANLLSGITIRTYKNGTLRESSNSGTLVSVGSSLLTGSGKQTVGFVTTLDFDEVKIEVTNLLGIASTTNVYGAVFQSFCAGPALPCNTLTALATPTYPVLVAGPNTGISGIACVLCSVDSTNNLIDNLPNNSARINLTAGVGAIGSIAVRDQLTDYPAGTFVAFDIENTALLDVSLLNGITITTYLNGNPVAVESQTGPSALLSVNTGLLTNSGRRTVGFVTTAPFDEVRLRISNTLAVNVGITRVYNVFFEKFCPIVLECSKTNYLNTPDFPVIIDDARTGVDGLACVGCSVQNTPNVISSDNTDYAVITTVVGAGSPATIAVKDVLTTYPAGSTAGFVIQDVNTILQVDLFNSITVSTYNNGVLQESRSGGNLLDLNVLNLLNIGLNGSNDYNIGFRTTLPYDEIQISVGSLVSAINIIRVYGAFVDTRGSQDSNLNCCPTTAPQLSANTISNSCPAVTVNLNSLVTNLPAMGVDSTVRWFTNNTATGTRYATPTMATAGTYYAFFFDTVDSCYGPASGAVTVTINPCPPTITSDGGGATASISVPENTTAVTTVVASDPENGTITYSITGGADQAKFSINPGTGVLTFNTAPDFDVPTDAGLDNVYDVQVTATDPTNTTDVQDIAVTVTNVLEDPIITSNGGGNSASISVAENTTAVTTVVATDPDNGAITYSISGGADAALFSIDPMTGVLTFNTAPDFETPTDIGTNNVYDVQVTATDPSNSTDVQSIAVTVTNVNEAPSITSDGAGATATIPVVENTTTVTTVTATDPENAYGTPKFSITGGADAAKFSIDPMTGVLVFNTAPDFDVPTDANTDNNYEVTVRVTDAGGLFDEQAITVPVTNALEDPIITSNGGGNSASVSVAENTTAVTTVVATDPDNGAITYSITGGADAALFSIDPMTGVLTFNTAPDFETPTDVGTNNVYDVQVTATDPSNATDVQSIAVTVTNVNEAPSITSDGAAATATVPVVENTTAVTTVTATDPENAYGTPKFSITGGADAALFTINATTGALSFNTAPNFETPTDANTDNNYEVTVRVTDAGGLFDEQAITVPVTNASENPVITSNGGGNSASVSVPENTTAVTTVVATDPDNGAITYSISGGADAALFSIDPMTGVLTFNTAPDFETPADAGLNNVYNVQVTATDASNATDVQDIAVTVTDVPESGPALVCNTPTRMNNPTYPTVINGANTGISGALCVLCAVNNANNAISSSTTDFASIILTAGIAATGSLSIQDPATDYPAGTFVGFDIENTNLVGTNLLDQVTITTFLNGNLVESFTGQSALISVGSSILTDNGRRVIGFISTGSFDEARISFSNTVLISLGTTRVYGAVFESFCGTTLECNETYALNNPEFSVIIDDALSGLDGVACVACSVADAPNAISADTTDYSTLTVITGTSATASLAVKDAVNTFPAGSTVGFTIQDVNTLAQVNLFNSISICTYNNGIQQECKTGNGLLDLSLLNNINASLNGAGDYNLGFRSTLEYDEVRIIISAVAGVSNIIRVYGAFVDTRGANDANLNCCPTTAPILSANTISNTCPAVTVDLNSLVTNLPAMGADSMVVWFTNSGATGTAYATPTMAAAGTYYAFFFDTVDSCYGPASGAVTVTINPCPPTITSDGGGATASISVPENTTAVTTVVATDPENGTITYSITGGADQAKFSINPSTGVLTFNTAPDFDVPTDAGLDNVYDVQVTATDPTNATDVQDIAVTVTNVLEDPIITSNGGGNSASVSVVENTTAVTTVVATDPDNGAITYTITGGADAALFSIDPMTGVLTFNTAPDFDVPTDAGLNNVYDVQVTATDPSNATDVQDIAVTVTNVNEAPSITSDGAGATATVPVAENTTAVTTVTATDPENAYGTPKFSITGGADAALFTINATTGALSFNTAPNFETPTDANTDNNYEVTVRVTDAGGLFDEQAITVPVTNALEDPIITSNGGGNSASVSVAENTTVVTTMVATDPDNGAITYTITGGADAALFSIDPMTGVLTFNTAPDFDVPTDAGLNNVYDVQVTATDPGNATDVQDISVTVTNVNEAPSITSDGAGATATVPVAENTTAVTTVTATDPENAYGTPKFSITGGADAAKFSIDPMTGVLVFNTAPDFDVPTDANTDNNYEVTVRVTDAGGLFDEQAITVPVTNASENPVITSNGGGNSASVSVAENTTAVTTVVATDPDNGAITYSITGGADAALFSIDPMTGVLTFNIAPDFETPTDVGTNNVYDVQVTATDPSNATDVQSIAVTVTNVNETPSITSDGATATATVPVVENTTAVTTVTAIDPENAYGTPKFSITGGADAALFTINATTGALSFNTAPNFETPTDANTDNNYEVTVRVTDAGGLFDEQAITVPVTNASENPVITSNGGGNSASVSVPENTTAVTTVVATDPDNGAITYSISGGADAALFSIDPMTGVLNFNTAPDFETPADAGLNNVYNVQVTATDASNATDVQDIAVTVTDVPEGGPALVCNTPTRMNNPTYPTVINGANTGISGALCVLCAVNNANNAISSSTTDFASIILTAGIAATGSLSIQDPATDYPAGTFVGFDIENTNLVGTDLLDRVTITTYLNGNLVESFTGQSALISVGSSILTDNGRRVIGFISTGSFDEARISFSNTVLISLGTTRVYGAVFESFCGTTLECNETYALNNPEFSVIIDDALSGLDGVACVACSVADAPNAISADTTDYSTLTVITGTSATASLAVKDAVNTFPAGSTVGFTIQDVNTLAQVNLFNSISICTYNNGIQQECTTGNGLLDLSLLNNINASLNGAGDYNLGFRSTLEFDEVRITISAVAGVSNIIRVYGAFVDTRGANDANLNCCPTTAPILSANTISNTCPAVTVDLNSLVTNLPAMGADSIVRWFTNNGATGTLYATPTMAAAGTYYAFFFDTVDSCYGPASGAVTVTINPCPPAITSNGGGNNASVSVPENTTAVTTVVASDPENGTITYSITGGADAAKFSIDPMTGVLVFNTAPDYENPTDVGSDNVYDVQVTATDPSNATDVQDIAVTVTDVNEAPTITSNGGGATATIPVVENTTAVTTVTATDPENAYGTPKFSITGGADAAKFSIDPNTGALSFLTAPDFDVPTDANLDNNYEVQVTVTDAGNLTDVQDITVTVTDANENGLLSVKVLLQGALFNSPTPGVMRDDLRSGNYIPLNDPYTGSGNPRFAHAGAGGLASTTVGVLSANAGTNDAIVDWVFIELRSSVDPTIVVETRAALLQRDGDVVSPADGISPLALPGTVGNSYFVAVKHRNHLGVMTANLQAFTMAGTTVDFRTMSDADVFNFTSPFSYDGYEMVTVNGFKALWAGNANSDIKVKYQGPTNDNATVLNQVLTFGGNTLGIFNYDLALGYFSGDINLDGKVKYQGAGNDPNFLFLNLITNFVLNSLDLYNYDLFTEQIP